MEEVGVDEWESDGGEVQNQACLGSAEALVGRGMRAWRHAFLTVRNIAMNYDVMWRIM